MTVQLDPTKLVIGFAAAISCLLWEVLECTAVTVPRSSVAAGCFAAEQGRARPTLTVSDVLCVLAGLHWLSTYELLLCFVVDCWLWDLLLTEWAPQQACLTCWVMSGVRCPPCSLHQCCPSSFYWCLLARSPACVGMSSLIIDQSASSMLTEQQLPWWSSTISRML